MSNAKQIKVQGDLDTLALMSVPDAVPIAGRDGFGFEFDDMVKGHNIPEDRVPAAIAAAKTANKFLSMSTFPHFGLKIRFTGVRRVEKNGYNGQITYYGYVIEGLEAVSFGWFDNLVAALEVFGKVDLRACKDIEA